MTSKLPPTANSPFALEHLFYCKSGFAVGCSRGIHAVENRVRITKTYCKRAFAVHCTARKVQLQFAPPLKGGRYLHLVQLKGIQ